MSSLGQRARRRLLRILDAGVEDDTGSEIVDGKGHREYVGGLWEAVSSLQFRFMVEQGLEPQHVLLDVACGSLRGGVRFIPYLEAGNYLGLDIKQELIDIGIEHELGAKLHALKKPEFVVSGRFEFNRFSRQPGFAIAQSLFTHLTAGDIQLCLQNLRQVAVPRTRFYVTFFESQQPVANPGESDPHGGFRYTRTQMAQFGEAHGWAGRYIGDWQHPRQQMMFEYYVRSGAR